MSFTYGPRYLCRRKLAIDLLKEFTNTNKKVLEIGFGGGHFTATMEKMGYKGVAIDFSKEAFEALQKLAGKDFGFKVENKSDENVNGKFDAIVAFEVLEHIKEDGKALKRWNSLLNEGGHLFLSVPAHRRRWSLNDEFAGHIRRYEKTELTDLLGSAGFEIKKFYSYGYPIANITESIRSRLIDKVESNDRSLEEKTKNSGVSNLPVPFGKIFFNDITMMPFYFIQSFFLDKDLGSGYLVCCEKSRNSN